MTRACPDQIVLLGALLDGELDAANVASVEAHLAGCAGCREEFARLQALRSMIERAPLRHSAPDSLRQAVAAAIPDAAPRRQRPSFGWLGPAAGGAVAASLAMLLFVQPPHNDSLEQQLISSHLRSLQPGHLMDVQTTDQHVVKPWFNGKVDFSPPVPELAAAGFPLAGGRLDSINGKTVAAIVYHRRLHTVNVYVWPAAAGADRSSSDDGFTIDEWNEGGLHFAAVSDIPRQDLARFEAAFRGSAHASVTPAAPARP